MLIHNIFLHFHSSQFEAATVFDVGLYKSACQLVKGKPTSKWKIIQKISNKKVSLETKWKNEKQIERKIVKNQQKMINKHRENKMSKTKKTHSHKGHAYAHTLTTFI